MFVFWPFLAPNIASHPEHKSFFSWICWFDSWKFHFYKNWKAQIILFGYKTHHKNSYPICFMTWDIHVYCKFFHLLFLICCFCIKSKIEKRKIQFLVTKRGQKPYPICFLKPQSPILGGFICYFWFIAILLRQNLKNVKYRFWLQKGIKNWKW